MAATTTKFKRSPAGASYEDRRELEANFKLDKVDVLLKRLAKKRTRGDIKEVIEILRSVKRCSPKTLRRKVKARQRLKNFTGNTKASMATEGKFKNTRVTLKTYWEKIKNSPKQKGSLEAIRKIRLEIERNQGNKEKILEGISKLDMVDSHDQDDVVQKKREAIEYAYKCNRKIDGENTNTTLKFIEKVEEDVRELEIKIEGFHGERNGREFFYLNKMLLRNVEKLDKISPEGNDIMAKRKSVIKYIYQCMQLLEQKAAN